MAAPETFSVSVDGVGSFLCRRRTMRVAVAVSAEYNRLTEGAEVVAPQLDSLANFLAYLKAMVVVGPDDWEPYAADPESERDMEQLQKVFMAIKEAEGRFRRGADTQPQAESAGA